MATCSDSEMDALGKSGPLLQFAAEHVKNLDPDLSLAIAEAGEAVKSQQWTPEISQRFWTAYAKLCELIDPVSMDCLAVAQENIVRRIWLGLGGTKKISLAQRSSSRYLKVLVVLLIPLLFLQLYVWTCTNLSKQIDDLLTQDRSKLVQLTNEYIRFDRTTPSSKPYDNWSGEEVADADKISADSAALLQDGARIAYAAEILDATFPSQIRLIFSPTSSTALKITIPSSLKWFDRYHSADDFFNNLQSEVPKVQARANLVIGILLSFILPILFGTLGAVAYVVRSISDQISKTTFAHSTPTRHLMRVALGALLGMVVGLFSGLTSTFSLPPLAIAFLAGYGVEAVFSMFDNLIQKFR
jgi:hypothetical protein